MSNPILFVQDNGDTVSATLAVDRLTEANSPALSEPLLKLAQDVGARPLHLNLEQVTFLASHGLALLFTLYQNLQRQGGELILTNVQPQVYELFESTQLHKIFRLTELARSVV
jgi:anti-anti-sigma factor